MTFEVLLFQVPAWLSLLSQDLTFSSEDMSPAQIKNDSFVS